MAFTTWAALQKQMLDALASGNPMAQEFSIDGQTMRYRTMDDFLKGLEYVIGKAAEEAAPTAVARTYARPARR